LQIEKLVISNDYRVLEGKSGNIYLFIEKEEIIGAITCNGNEIDDLIVNKKFQHRGYGRELLLWGMHKIKENGYKERVK